MPIKGLIGYVIGPVCVLDVCQHDWQSNQPIHFGSDTADSRIRIPSHFLHFPHHYGIEHFRKFISISHTVTGWFSRNLAKWLTTTSEWIHYTSGAIRQIHGYESVRKSIFETRITCGWGFGEWLALADVVSKVTVFSRPMSRCPDIDSYTGQVSLLHTCSSGGIIWPRTVLSCLVLTKLAFRAHVKKRTVSHRKWSQQHQCSAKTWRATVTRDDKSENE